jgi:hypothetical protein
MEDQIAWDYLVAFVTLAALAVGLISMAVGKITDWRESREPTRQRQRRRQPARRRARPALPVHVMLRSGGVGTYPQTIKAEQRSYAAERLQEPSGTGGAEPVPDLWEHLGTLADDQLLDILARATMPDGTYKYAESRIAKFIGGRVEDRIAQVRAVRGIVAPPKPTIDPRYPQRTPEQEALRQQLLKQKGALN